MLYPVTTHVFTTVVRERKSYLLDTAFQSQLWCVVKASLTNEDVTLETGNHNGSIRPKKK